MYEISEQPFADAPPHRLCFGTGRCYDILKDGAPYLRVETHPTFHQTHLPCCIFGSYLCIGEQRSVRFIDLETLASDTMGEYSYFGYFEPLPDMLLFSTNSAVIALGSDLRVRWQTDDLAADGILFAGVTPSGAVQIQCCTDPIEPNGWYQTALDLQTGQRITL